MDESLAISTELGMKPNGASVIQAGYTEGVVTNNVVREKSYRKDNECLRNPRDKAIATVGNRRMNEDLTPTSLIGRNLSVILDCP